MYDGFGIVQESLLDPEQTADSLLNAIRQNVESSVNTVEQATSIENQLSEQAAQFNYMLTTIENAFNKCEAGEITPDQAKAEVAPCVSALKNNCKALSLSGTNVSSDDISEDEIAILREVIVGAKDIVSARKKDLEDCPISANASEGVMSMLNNMDPAYEASIPMQIFQSTEKKTADELYKTAKKLYGYGNEAKAVEYMTKAKKLYEKALANLKKNTTWRTAKRTIVSGAFQSGVGALKKDEFTASRSSKFSVGYLADYLERRIDSCQAWLMKWKNKSGSADFKTYRDQLAQERKDAKAAHKAARKAGKSATEGWDWNDLYEYDIANEGAVTEYFDALDEFEDACESLMNTYELELSASAALESDGMGETDESSPSGIGARLRALFGKLRKAKSEGDDNAARSAASEIKDVAHELDNDDGSEEKKKGLSTAAKIGLAAAATTAAVVGLTVLGQQAKKSAEAKGTIPAGKAGATLIKISDAIVGAKDTAVSAAKSGAHAVDIQFRTARENRRDRAEYKREQQRAKDREARSEVIQNTMEARRKKRERDDTRATNAANRQKVREAHADKSKSYIDSYPGGRLAYAADTIGGKIKSMLPSKDSWTISDLVLSMATEGSIDDFDEDSSYDQSEGRAFDPETMFGSQMIEDAEEADTSDDDLASEAYITSMMLDDGFGDEI